ncbi:hypothetical protein JMF97_25290 [Micromonospora fiedleri]|uniref:Neocarzinostatin family protein n=1 Tax=Micromonospora fiedleri TaxID=1157498 RepID=A0ABS1UUE9_9ACTN|nr:MULTISPECIES: hypothetical protein [Micromonospora]MBL6279474.1 hypothetical protein [Micromonospora fiedleri]WSK45525.1 hypothetical protein OG712_12630 [Micromonospora maris]
MTRTRPALSAATFAAPVLTLLTVTPLLAMALVGAPTPARAAGPAATHAVAQPVAAPQPPGPNVFIEVSPSTVEPGHLVGLRASCQDNSVGAIAVSDAFGRVAVQPQRGLLTGTAQVKDRVLPGNYRVKLECRGGESASTMLQVVRAVKPSRGPATGFGGGAGGTSGLLLPGGLALTVSGMILWVVAARRRQTGR